MQEPVRVSAGLRLPLIGLIVLMDHFQDIQDWLPTAYAVVLAVYTVAALGWLVFLLRGPIPPWSGWVSTSIDVVAMLALCVVSGGATAWLLPVFFLVPISVAFQDHPALTAAIGIASALGYLVVWIVYSKRDDTVGLPNSVYVDVGFLLWLAVATTALCFVLRRRSARVTTLLEARRRLVSEAMRAEERHSRELAEQLHDGPLQELLAARLELDELRERHADPALDAVDSALHTTAARLRGAVTALHPQVLAEVGLTAAIQELVRQYENRGSFAIDADLEELGRPQAQSLIYRAAGELLSNVHKHANASTVRLRLFRVSDRIILTVADDGSGFDPATLNRCVADGHIGLASLMVRVDAMGGSMDIESTESGTCVSLIVPADTS